MFNSQLDKETLNTQFAENKLLVIEKFLEPEFAQRAFDYLNNKPDSEWYLAFCPVLRGTRKSLNLLNNKQNRPSLSKLNELVKEQYELGEFSFKFKRSVYEAKLPLHGPERELVDLFKSESLLRLIKTVTNKDLSGTDSLFTSCYETGDFLAKHDDGDNGEIGFIYYLCPDWNTEWGGHLKFTQKKNGETYANFAPGYNQLLLFAIRDLKNLNHEVTPISEGAKAKRIAFSGWFG
ncbi:2OG-Fe(II) oxygenase family protein [Roseivirga sp. E12]|uniref:2OG-Fe(II) oxygenase n=1 Tax=Roseivirga sp. E12 TaxID=2819237 RepID=UPI001ABD02CE|nr:2OG-Fe(II) oxygenase family protein [Roseivirga sp. E12]MBO3699064.1 2OG-Fe(II) oxygenase [Roseivirga sp. E12]